MLTEIKVCAQGLEKGKERGGYGCQENRIGFKNKNKKTLKVESASGRKLSMLKLCVILTVKEFIYFTYMYIYCIVWCV